MPGHRSNFVMAAALGINLQPSLVRENRFVKKSGLGDKDVKSSGGLSGVSGPSTATRDVKSYVAGGGGVPPSSARDVKCYVAGGGGSPPARAVEATLVSHVDTGLHLCRRERALLTLQMLTFGRIYGIFFFLLAGLFYDVLSGV